MLLSCGDALIDFVPVKAADGRDAYVPAVGGSCLNIAVAMSRLGSPTGFVGGISTDMFGKMVVDHLAASNVSLRHARHSDNETTLAFVRLVNGEPHYAFYDEATSAQLWTYDSTLFSFNEIEALHVGSTTLINEPAATEYLKLLRDAKGRTTLSFDPNCRPSLVRDKAKYLARMAEFSAIADIVRMSDLDFDFLFGGDDFQGKANEVLAGGVVLFVVTRGGEGVIAWHATAGQVEVPAPAVKVVDTIGAGDTFQGSLLVALREAGRIERPALETISRDELAAALAFGTRCAAVTCSRAGANPPWKSEISPNQDR
jgi:fructokinase